MNCQTIVAKEVILQLPMSLSLLVCLGQVQEELLEVQNPAISGDQKIIEKLIIRSESKYLEKGFRILVINYKT